MKGAPLIDPTSCIYAQRARSSPDDYFKNNMVRACNATHPDAFHRLEWCPTINPVIHPRRVYDSSPYLSFCTRTRSHDGNFFGPEVDEHQYFYHNGMMSFGALFTIVPYLGDEG